jgi:hypothetical protein
MNSDQGLRPVDDQNGLTIAALSLARECRIVGPPPLAVSGETIHA